MAKLVVFRGDNVESEVRLRDSVVRIGRDARNEIVLDDSTQSVSRFHAEVRPDRGAYVIADLKSRNGVWMHGQRIHGKADLALGVPVTIGSFELVIEDDVATGAYDDGLASGVQATVAVPTGRDAGTSRPGALPGPARTADARSKQRLIIGVVVALTVVGLGAIAWIVVRNIAVSEQQVTVTTAPPVTTVPATTSATTTVREDPNRARIEEALSTARIQMQSSSYAAALDSLAVVLALDPQNADALELKRQADEAMRPRTTVKPPPPSVVALPGIPVRPGETAAEYAARAARIQAEVAAGRESLGRGEYAAAIKHLRAAEQDEPQYPGVGNLLAEATSRRQTEFTAAMANGQGHESRGNLKDARGWYEHAVALDPESTAARDKAEAVRGRLFDTARKLLEQGNYAMKADDTESAIAKFRQVLDLLRPGDEMRDEAARRLEELKR